MYCRKKKLKQSDLVYDNTSKDLIPKRGYYSELVSDVTKIDMSREMLSYKKRMKLILQVRILFIQL